jgi:hypothetical protein
LLIYISLVLFGWLCVPLMLLWWVCISLVWLRWLFFFNFISNIMVCWFYVSFVVFSSFDRMYYLLALFCSFCIIGFCSSYISFALFCWF